MASSRSTAADDIAHGDSLPPPTSEPTPTTAFQQHHNTATSTPFLPGNPPIHLAPSITHQPEPLLLSWMFDTLYMLVTRILGHPIAAGPMPDPNLCAGNNAHQLFYQFHRSIVRLRQNTLHLMRARRLLQFIPGPPGSPGQYRMDPTVYFPPHIYYRLPLNCSRPVTPPQSPARSHRHSRPPPPSPFWTDPPLDRNTRPSTPADALQPAAADLGETDTSSDFHLRGHSANSVS